MKKPAEASFVPVRLCASFPCDLRARPGRARPNLRLIALALALAALAWFISPRAAGAAIQNGAGNSKVINRIAAVVNNEIITEVQLSAALAAREKNRADAPTRQEILDALIDDALFNQIMSKSKIEVTDDDVARAVTNVLHQNRMSIDQLKSELASKGIPYEEYRKQIEKEIRKVKFTNQVIGPQVKITDQDLRDYYQRNQEKFRGGTSVNIAEIVLPLDGVSSEAEMRALGDTAVSITARARKGTSFDLLAKQHSKGPNAAQGGNLGMLNVKDLQPEIANVVRGLKVGDVSDPFLIENAIAIVKLIALPEISPGDFEQMRDQIYNSLYEQKIEETAASYLQRERQKAFIEVR